jgi:hypothetical protein
MIRCYFNTHETTEGAWSVDSGPGTPEQNVDVLKTWGFWQSEIDPSAPEGTPSAWLANYDETATVYFTVEDGKRVATIQGVSG